ncbi:MAG: hypothetical protein ACR2NP_12895 [Pirellulaceae bacterium]
MYVFKTTWQICIASILLATLNNGQLHAQDGNTDAEKVRIGTFDSRAIAVAWASSASFSEYVQGLRNELEQAKADGDEDRVKELEAFGPALQHILHKQGFSTWPIDNILDQIRDKIPEIARDAEVALVVSKWDVEFAADNIEHVDVTDAMVQLFDPDEKTLEAIKDLREQEPVPLEDIKD